MKPTYQAVLGLLAVATVAVAAGALLQRQSAAHPADGRRINRDWAVEKQRHE